MEKLKKETGQITIPVLLTIGGLIASSVAGIFGMQLSVKAEVSAVSERVARLEESVPDIRDDVKEIKGSIQGIEKWLRSESAIAR